MIDRKQIEIIATEALKETEVFLVDVLVSRGNVIQVFIDHNKGVSLDDCGTVHRAIEENLDREQEDFELQVSSPGLDLPFVVIDQYYKNEGRKVEVVDNEGTKYIGKLKNVTSGGFEIESEIKVKGKKAELKDISFNFEQIKTTRVILTIK